MRFIYSCLMYLISPYLLIRLWWKGRALPAYRKRILERFALDSKQYDSIDIWVHSVSLGEVIAAIPLIQSFLNNNKSVLVTTMTPTGSKKLIEHFGTKVAHCYIPYDLSCSLKRFFKRTKPSIGIIMETELWPNLINQAIKAKVVLFLANARLSSRSLNGYLRFKPFFKGLLNQFRYVFAQSEEDASRFKTLGADPSKLFVSGNIKFDMHVNSVESTLFKDLKRLWNEQRPVFIAASTHDNEEEQVLSKLRAMQQLIPGIILLIAPRHPERFQTVYQLALNHGFNTGLRSDKESLSFDNEVIILDSLGELLGWYSVSDYAFVGGSLVPVGGHNVLEPIAMKVPVISGTQVHNFRTICADLISEQAIDMVSDVNELVDVMTRLHKDDALKRKRIESACLVLERNRGSLGKHLEKIESCLKSN